MSTAGKRRRGRPKGSGIDDSGRLVEIAARIAAEPSLKPTTAIKAMGITDPSSIRRLRDKYKKFAAAAGHCLAQSGTAKASPYKEEVVPPPATYPKNEETISTEMTAVAAEDEKQDTEECDNVANGQPERFDSEATQVQIGFETVVDGDWIATWCVSNLETAIQAFEKRMPNDQSDLNAHSFAFSLRQQFPNQTLIFGSLLKTQKRRTLH